MMQVSRTKVRAGADRRAPVTVSRAAIAAAIAVLALSIPLLSCGGSEAVADRATPVAVRTTPAELHTEPRMVSAVGSLRSDQEAVLSGKIMGTVLEIRRQAGEFVRRGEVLVVLDGRDVAGQIGQARGALAQARAAHTLAETNLRRFEQLFERGAASQLELDQARFQYETAAGAVAQADGAVATARSYESYAEIAAPFDGWVVDRMVEAGDLAAPGRPLLRIEDARRLRLEVSLPEREQAVATPGALVRVIIPSLGDLEVEGTVREIVPSVDPSTRSLTVKVAVAETAGLRSGLYARALFSAESKEVLRIPSETVRARGGLTGVYVAEDGRATFRLISVGGERDGGVEVLSGLRAGDAIIVSPAPTLEEGAAVEVQS